MNNIYKCPNCGAAMEKYSPKCPFCGYINEEGAERQYMEKLDKVRRKLDVVDEEAAGEYKKSYKKLFIIIVATLLVFAALATAYFLFKNFAESIIRSRSNASGEDMLKEMTWQRENFPRYDSLYEAGKYDELLEAVYADYEHDTYKWEHKDFVYVYGRYHDTVMLLTEVDKNGWNEYAASAATYNCMFFYYGNYAEELDEEEQEILKPCRDEMETIIKERLNYSEDELNRLKDEVINQYGNIEYDKCEKVAKKYYDRYQ